MTPARAPGQPSGVGGSEFGFTRGGGRQFHNGFDQDAPVLISITAPADGTLTVGFDDKAGLHVTLDLGNGASVSFSHLSKAPAGLAVGEALQVQAGQTIGEAGTSGNSAGSGRDPHVHIVTRVNQRTCNPRDFFSQSGGGGSCGN